MADPEAGLRTWIEEVADVSVTRVERLAGGGSREAWNVEAVDRQGQARPLFLRRDLGVGPVSGTELTLHREAGVCGELRRLGIPVSTIVADDPVHDVVLAERAAGTGAADFTALVESPHRDEIIADFVDTLARLHNLDPALIDLPEVERPATATDHALLEVRRWRRFYEEKSPRPDPILEAVFSWLERHPPDSVERTVLVHGDCGPGNFMFEDDHVTCIVDWEFAHFGDPMDDIAWLGFRQHTTGGLAFADLAASLQQWAAATGLRLDPPRISYYGLLVLARCATCCVRGLANAGATIDNSVWHGLQPRMRRAMTHLLADLVGVTPDPLPDVEPAAPSEPTRVLATIRRDLEHVILEHLSSDDAIKRAKGHLGLLDYLAAAQRSAGAVETAEVTDLRSQLGGRYTQSADALDDLLAWIQREGPEDHAVVAYLCRRADRDALPWIEAGLLRNPNQPFPPLYRHDHLLTRGNE